MEEEVHESGRVQAGGQGDELENKLGRGRQRGTRQCSAVIKEVGCIS